jgi:hypothetical protein
MNKLNKYHIQCLKCTIYIICFLYSKIGICFDSRGAWIDIPTASFVGSLANDSNQLEILINQYHAINKMQLDLLSKRIDFLERIHLRILQVVENKKEQHSNKLLRLDNLVKKKIWYLSKIRELYDHSSSYDGFLNVGSREASYTPLILVNKVLFDFKLPIYWGLYWLEALDPCHRFLTGHYLKWKESESPIPFFLWLEEQEIPYNSIQITYLNESDISKHQLEIKDGIFVSSVDKSAVTYERPKQEYLFVINLKNELIVIEGSESIRHSSMSLGRPVLGAGSLKIHNGKITYIDAESGHYQPTPIALLQAIELLEKQGAILKYSTIQVKYYDNGKEIQSNARLFMQKYKEMVSQKPTSHHANIIEEFKI